MVPQMHYDPRLVAKLSVIAVHDGQMDDIWISLASTSVCESKVCLKTLLYHITTLGIVL